MTTSDPFADVTRIWWERYAAMDDWKSAAAIARVSTERRPTLSAAWENLAWALHKQGKTREAYKTLAPKLKGLDLPGPPSGRAAYTVACFCGALNRCKEGVRWLRLAYTLSVNRDDLRIQALLEPDLRDIWPSVPELSMEACSLLE